MDKQKLHDELKQYAFGMGAVLFGVADLSKVKHEFELDEEILEKLDKGISIGARINPLVVSEIEKRPTQLYLHHYKTVNHFLDQIALKLTNYIISNEYLALPIPASQITDWKKQTSHVSHKKVAYLSGVGWQGRNNLLVNEKFGSHFRLVTVLTNMPLKLDKPKDLACGKCMNCVKVCPAGAIKERPEDFDHIKCFEKVREFQKNNLINQYICGICIRACRGSCEASR
ncbi:MAG TPA: epoxyqueuosine reductase [Candidatus Omnitrophica bacterium]|nr:epoxyqueuosine reductase [Candidatus Omnitrophota bacterium]